MDWFRVADVARIAGGWWTRTDSGLMHQVVPSFDCFVDQFSVPWGKKCVYTYWDRQGRVLAQEVRVALGEFQLLETRTAPPWLPTTPGWWSDHDIEDAVSRARTAGVPEFAIVE